MGRAQGQNQPVSTGTLVFSRHAAAQSYADLEAHEEEVTAARDDRGFAVAEKLALQVLQANKDRREFRVDVVVDRSGSVHGEPGANEDQLDMALTFAFLDEQTKGQMPTSIYGYTGGMELDEYSFKDAGEGKTEKIDQMMRTGGGGTPTALAVEASRRRLAASPQENKVMTVITDGYPNSPKEMLAQIKQARQEGTAVVGLVYESFGSPYGLSETECDEMFGKGHWRKIRKYSEAPSIVADLIAKASSLPA
jgi:hypothetical protein